MSGIALSITVVLLALASSTVCELTNRSSHCMIEAATATLRLCDAPSSAQLQQNRTSTPAEITAPDCCLYQQHCIDAAVVLRVVCDLQSDNTKDLINALGTSKGKCHKKMHADVSQGQRLHQADVQHAVTKHISNSPGHIQALASSPVFAK
jgi:hypothetical protein